MAATPVFLPGEFHGWRSLMGCRPWGHKESDTTERLSTIEYTRTGCAPHEFQIPLHLSDSSFSFNFPLIQPLPSPQNPTKNPHSLFLYSICSALLLSKKEAGASLRPHHHTKTLRYMSCFNILNTKYFEIIEKVKVAQSCLALCEPMDYTFYGLLQARILEWVAVPISRASSQPRD